MLFLPKTSRTVPGHQNGQLVGCMVSIQVLQQTAAWPSRSSRKQAPHRIGHFYSSMWEPLKLSHLLRAQLCHHKHLQLLLKSPHWSRNKSGLHPPPSFSAPGDQLQALLLVDKRITCQHLSKQEVQSPRSTYLRPTNKHAQVKLTNVCYLQDY